MPRGLSLVSSFDPNWEYLNKTIHNQFRLFFENIFFLLQFRLTTVNFSYARKMVCDITAAKKTDLIELEMRLVIKKSRQWP